MCERRACLEVLSSFTSATPLDLLSKFFPFHTDFQSQLRNGVIVLFLSLCALEGAPVMNIKVELLLCKQQQQRWFSSEEHFHGWKKSGNI